MDDVPDTAGDVVDQQEPLLGKYPPPAGQDDEALSEGSADMQSSEEADGVVLPSYIEEVDLDSTALRAQGHEAQLTRSFSPLAALGLGFRRVDMFSPVGPVLILTNC